MISLPEITVMKLIDTHIHLYDRAFSDDLGRVIARARAAGIEHFLTPDIDATYTPAMLALKEKYPDSVHIMSGLHPTSVEGNYTKALDHVEKIADTHDCVAIGEIGIDLYWDTSRRREQIDAFRIQLRMAKERQLPVSIHCRDAFDEVLKTVEQEQDGSLQGVLHCFTGTREQAKACIDLGLYLGIGGVATFKNGKIDRFLNEIEPSHILLETDAPYLAPTPYRGKRNEPAYLKLVAEKLSGIYSLPVEEIARITTSNARQLFRV